MIKEEIIYIEVSKLKLNEKNPRKNDNAVDGVAKSIKKYGFKNPLIVDKNNVVWCGNTRLKASKQLGLKEVPCIVVDDLTEEQIREYALLDNKLNEIAEWDYELLGEELSVLDLDEFELDWNTSDNDIDWDNVQELSEKTYDEPEKKYIRCPNCGHIDTTTHFIKVNEE